MTVAMARRVVVGDIHGHYQGLMDLMALLNLQPADQIYFLGDLIDRGPDSAKVVEFVKTNHYPALMGNHEEMMVSALMDNQPALLQMWLQAGGRETLTSYSSNQLLWDHADWFKTLPTHLDLGNYWLVHAGVHPELPLETQTSQEFCWIRQEFHQMATPYFGSKVIIVGHTMTFTFPGVNPGQIVQGAGWLGIDTGAYHHQSGWLTALDIVAQQVYQVNIHSHHSRICPLADLLVCLNPQTKQNLKGVSTKDILPKRLFNVVYE
ncbi:MAG: serine/threonine protein phosphatase [Acaryochloridaceae cyanobacterium SU_2_1]|nr:serine/threonine protein phosphatase [Acaryochloridaceae cyanobacterium SU_2_1]